MVAILVGLATPQGLALDSCSFDKENASKVELVLQVWPDIPVNIPSALRTAIEMGALAAIQVLTNRFGTKIFDCKEASEETPIHWAVWAGIAATIDYLISGGSFA